MQKHTVNTKLVHSEMQKLLFSFIIYAHLKHCMPVSTLQDLHSDLQGAI